MADTRVDPMNANVDNLPLLSKTPPDKRGPKVDAIHSGGSLMHELPPFPDSRPCRDCFWALLWLITIGGVFGIAFAYSGDVWDKVSEVSTTPVPTEGNALDGILGNGRTTAAPTYETSSYDINDVNVWNLVAATAAGTAASLGGAFVFLIMAHKMASCVVHVALFLGPALQIVSGIAMVVIAQSTGSTIMLLLGILNIFLGVCMACCIFTCWKHLIPFTITVVETLAEVTEDHPCMLFISVFGSFVSLAWVFAFTMAIIGLVIKHQNDIQDKGEGFGKFFMGFSIFVFYWGSYTIYNVCYLIYCGVFGRWYFGMGAGALGPSITTALTTSFGSVAFGSFLTAVIQAVEVMVRQQRQEAQGEGNIVACLVLCVVECFISCIGDILEYFNEWAYVQCAIRGASFCQAAKITYSLCTCSNVTYIVTDLLINSVVGLGSIFCAVVGASVGALVSYMLEGKGEWVGVCAILAFCGGLLAGGTSLSVLSSGAKTILVCWAEDPSPLMQTHPETAQEFNMRIYGKLNGGDE